MEAKGGPRCSQSELIDVAAARAQRLSFPSHPLPPRSPFKFYQRSRLHVPVPVSELLWWFGSVDQFTRQTLWLVRRCIPSWLIHLLLHGRATHFLSALLSLSAPHSFSHLWNLFDNYLITLFFFFWSQDNNLATRLGSHNSFFFSCRAIVNKCVWVCLVQPQV